MEERIKIVENGICVDIEQLKKIIIDEWQSGRFYRDEYNRGHRGELLYRFVLGELSDYVDGLKYETERKAQEKLKKPEARLDWFEEYPKSDVRSIGFEVLKFLLFVGSDIAEVTTDDIPTILEFLDTPPDKSLAAWDKWEKYWASLDYPERRRKLLENAEK
ncbi:MAG: hypothetical protein P4L31_08035 [Candidatus Babeliales bacterium]|nr:hypothetical protein [Candidatus Babeliales bacterium]